MTEQFVPPAGSTVPSLSERLAENNSQKVESTQETKVENTMPFDITKLSLEQLQALKSALNVTPEATKKRKGNIVIKLREIEGKYVVDFSKAYSGLVRDHENMRDVNVLKIKVRFHGETEFQEMLYADFMNSKQKGFEVSNIRVEPEEEVQGEVVSAETGQLVEMVVKNEVRFYTINIGGDKVELHERLSNA